MANGLSVPAQRSGGILIQYGAALTVLAQFAFIVGLLLIWEELARNKVLDPFFYSQPSLSWRSIVEFERSGRLWSDTASTLSLLVVGWGLAVGVGSALGVLLAISGIAKEVFEPFLVFFNAFPRFLLLPLFMIWLGYGMAPQVAYVFAISLVVVILTVEAGVLGIDRNILANATVMGAGPLQLARFVYLPAIGLWLLASARTTVGFALHAALFAEYFGTNRGLGYLLTEARNNLNAPKVFAVIFIVATIGIVIDRLLAIVERRTRRWMQ